MDFLSRISSLSAIRNGEGTGGVILFQSQNEQDKLILRPPDITRYHDSSPTCIAAVYLWNIDYLKRVVGQSSDRQITDILSESSQGPWPNRW